MTETAAAGLRERVEEGMDRKGRSGPAAPLVTLRGEAALLLVVVMNSFGVVLMLHSGSGISAISSVPYGFSEAFPVLSLGTWTYLFQGLLVLSLFIMRRRFVPQYLFSFVVGFVFGVFVDIMNAGSACCRRLYRSGCCTFLSAICASASALLCRTGAGCRLFPRTCFPERPPVYWASGILFLRLSLM
mgnify:CR=1 FL=1